MTKGRSLSIGAAMKNRMQNPDEPQAGVVQAAPAAVTSEVVQDDPLESFNTRLPRSLQRRLKVYTVQAGRTIQDVMQQVLEEYLKEKESR